MTNPLSREDLEMELLMLLMRLGELTCDEDCEQCLENSSHRKLASEEEKEVEAILARMEELTEELERLEQGAA